MRFIIYMLIGHAIGTTVQAAFKLFRRWWKDRQERPMGVKAKIICGTLIRSRR